MSLEFIVRRTISDDVASLRKMQAQSWMDTYPNLKHGVSKKWVKDLTSCWLTPEALEKSALFISNIINSDDNFHCVAVIGQSVIGCIHVSNTDNQQTLQALYVDKKYHGLGVAQKLMDQAMDWLDKTKPIQLEVAVYNDRAIAFYRKYGFEIDSGSEHKCRDVIPVVNMIRKGDKK